MLARELLLFETNRSQIGKNEDSKICVTEIEQVVRIRIGEAGKNAL